MKILLIMEKSNIGGSQITTLKRINAFRRYGIQAEVVFFKKGNGFEFFSHIPTYHIDCLDDFKSLFRQNQYDIVSYIYNLKYINEVNSSFNGLIFYEVRGVSNKVNKHLLRLNRYPNVDGVICNAQHLKDWSKSILRKKIPIYVDWNTVDDQNFRFINDEITLPGLPYNSKNIIAYVGRVDKNKNWREFYEICTSLSSKHQSNFDFWIICDPDTSPELDLLQSAFFNAGLKEHLKIMKRIPYKKMSSIYSLVAISGGCVLSTSIKEGLGNHILEPMSCMCPVVSSNVLGKNEIITHEFNGMLYELGNIADGVKQLETLLFNTNFRKAIITNAKHTIDTRFSDSIYINNYLSIIENYVKLN